MARDLQLAMTLLARDQGSKVIRKALQDTTTDVNNARKAEEQLGRTREQTSQTSIRASRTLQQEYQRAASARETLGVRSERSIQHEIAQTQAAYNRLLRTGTMTANEQARAFSAMTNQVSRLRTELNGAGQSMSRMERMRMWGGNVTAVAGGLAAAGAVVAPTIRNQMSYEQRLAYMANTAFSDQNTAGRRKGMQSMDQLIRRSVSVGGGTKETAAETLDTLLASGAVDYSSAEKLLPMLQKYSTATEADPKELAQIAIRLKQSFGISDSQIPTALNMVIKSGQLGSFEIKNLAKWLPQQLAAANALGMNGLGDLAVLLGFNQTSMISAGTPDEAGNNVVNLLTKINSQDAANAAARIKYNGKGINLPGTLVRARAKGMNALEAFSGLTDKIVANNPEYQNLETQLKGTTSDSARREIMESQAKILEGSAIGQIIADRQALMALVAWRANRKYGSDVIKGVNQERELPANQQAGEQNFDLIQGTNLYRVNQFQNTKDFAEMDSVKSLSDVLGKLAGDLTEYAGAYPGLTKAIAGAEIAIKAMTVAAWAFAGLKFLTTAGGAAAAGAGGAAAGGAAASGPAAGLLKMLGLGMSATAAATFTTRDDDEELANGPAQWKALHARYSQDRIDKARKLYQPWYQFGPGYAKENQDWLDRLDHDEANGTVPWWTPPTYLQAPAANGYARPTYQERSGYQTPINITTQLVLDGKVVAEATNEYNSQAAARGPQGGPH
ncbi:phage tail tape measure protein [Martelella alba]|uniref:Phage tail tape measure protein n=1 Tax=Martelella alba TaxID=2590451 RepID=A0ABY2SSI1_9HYPH|nr:phage tail tape measure protein [Martelella alba]TKI08666.1 phage tail tape measure protein [Martelella alba]